MKALYLGDLAKLALATFTGAAIGFERESQVGQPERGRIYLSTYALSHDAACHSTWKLYSIPCVTDSVVRLDLSLNGVCRMKVLLPRTEFIVLTTHLQRRVQPLLIGSGKVFRTMPT